MRHNLIVSGDRLGRRAFWKMLYSGKGPLHPVGLYWNHIVWGTFEF